MVNAHGHGHVPVGTRRPGAGVGVHVPVGTRAGRGYAHGTGRSRVSTVFSNTPIHTTTYVSTPTRTHTTTHVSTRSRSYSAGGGILPAIFTVSIVALVIFAIFPLLLI